MQDPSTKSSSSTVTPSLGRDASRSAAIAMAGQMLRVGISAVGLIVLARLLTPADYGLTAMAIAIVGIGEVVRDFGLSMASLQTVHLSRQQRDNLFWLNSAIGLCIGLIVFCSSWSIANFYGDQRLVPIVQCLSLTFVLNGLGSQHGAYLQRNLKFAWLAFVDVASMLAALMVGIGMALNNYGYWALVAQQLCQPAVALVIVALGARWLPSLYDPQVKMGHFLHFGWNIMASQLLNYASKNAYSVVIGSQFGAGPLGLYNRAFQLLALPIEQISAPATKVALPVLSRLQDDKERYTKFLLTGQTVLLHLILAMFGCLWALAEPLIRVALGAQWLGSVPLFQILAIAGVFQAAGYAVYWVILSKGLARYHFQYSLIMRPLTVLLAITGANWGVQGVAWGYALGNIINWPVALFWIARFSDMPTKNIFFNGLRGLLAYGLGAACAFTISQALHEHGDLTRIVSGIVAMTGTLILEYILWPQFRSDIKAIAHAGKMLKSPA